MRRGLYASSIMATVANAGWSPLELANLYAWYDADQQTEADLGAIATLVDHSGNGRNFTQSTSGLRPFLRHNDFNGKKVIQLGETTGGSATATAMDHANTFLAGTSAGTMIYVVRAYSDPAGGSAFDGAPFGAINNHGGFTHIPYSDGNIYTGFCSNTRRSVEPPWELNNWHIFQEFSATNDYRIKINGYEVLTQTSNTVSLGTAVRKFGVGDDSNTSKYRGRFAEAIFTNSIISSTDEETILSYLAEKYNITHLLPATHPVKTYPSADHWRIRAIRTGGSNNAFGMRELEMYASTDGTGTNLAVLGGGVSSISSYENGSYPKTNAFNGNTSDFWTSLGIAGPAGGHWIGCQFPSPVSIGSFRVNTRGDFNETPQIYALEYSLDSGTTWQTIRAGGAIAGNTWVVLST